MRIIQLSDIHLSSANLSDLSNFYIDSLILDLKEQNKIIPIEIILFTGDLVDKGGKSLGERPYEVFEKNIIEPIKEALKLNNSQIFFIPGNHDVDTDLIDSDTEIALNTTLNKDSANERLKSQELEFVRANERLKRFKEFEKSFHGQTTNFSFTLNQSVAIVRDGTFNVGLALINDSWRCSPSLQQKNHFIGSNQLFTAKRIFDKEFTSVNIAVFHHPLSVINEVEKDNFDNILKSQNFDIAIFGHTHKHRYDSILSSNGGIIEITGRSVFYKPDEKEANYQPGYNILDIDSKSRTYTLYARKFILNGYRFDKDVDSLKNGEVSGRLGNKPEVQISNEATAIINDLPTGYSADVNKIVKLLMGKSLYPDQSIFVRELIQNSVDACKREQLKNPELTPKITVNINTVERYFQIIDEGDGMNKKILREHFAVVGKSISQEYFDGMDKLNLISQFGIGFISTFIVAKKVHIQTKSFEDEQINFTIEDVFKGFKYDEANQPENLILTVPGTSIKVFLKEGINPHNLLSVCKRYCRHIENIQFYLDDQLQTYTESWNTENGIIPFNVQKTDYEYRLTLSKQSRNIIASNTGFLITETPGPIIPFKFPYIIGGEVVFQPRAIDFDMSRTNILNNSKSIEFKKDLSSSLRILFRKAIDSKDIELIRTVCSYLLFYLVYYDNYIAQFNESYFDFYSKPELIDLCSSLIKENYGGNQLSLSEILIILKAKGISKIYYFEDPVVDDLSTVVIRFLTGNGHLVIRPNNITPQFMDGSITFSTGAAVQLIAMAKGFDYLNIKTVSADELSNMKLNKDSLFPTILRAVRLIEEKNQLQIEFAHFGNDIKSSLTYNDVYFINTDHPSYKDLFANIDKYSNEKIILAYLVGLIGVKLSSID